MVGAVGVERQYRRSQGVADPRIVDVRDDYTSHVFPNLDDPGYRGPHLWE